MYGFFNKLRPRVCVTVSGAMPEALLNACAAAGVEIISAVPLDAVTLRLTVPQRRMRQVRALAQRCMCTLSDETGAGAGALGLKLRHRAVVFALTLCVLGLLFLSRMYIWEIEVTGNETVSTGEILDALEQCGVGLGSFWPDFTSDSIRSDVLARLPRLSWLTVNVHGSRAEVIVRERIQKPEMIDNDEPYDIIAKKEGFVTEVRALAGSAQVTRGQAVSRGQTLISGMVEDITGGARTVHAYGEVKARTYYELTAVSPAVCEQKSYTGSKKSRWALVIGENRINFYGNSSISEGNCDKIYTEYKMELKGLFSLPVKLVREQCVFYERESADADAYSLRLLLEQELHRRLLEETNGGEIIYEHFSRSQDAGAISVCLRAECEEDIGLSKPREESTEGNREINDGTDDSG